MARLQKTTDRKKKAVKKAAKKTEVKKNPNILNGLKRDEFDKLFAINLAKNGFSMDSIADTRKIRMAFEQTMNAALEVGNLNIGNLNFIMSWYPTKHTKKIEKTMDSDVLVPGYLKLKLGPTSSKIGDLVASIRGEIVDDNTFLDENGKDIDRIAFDTDLKTAANEQREKKLEKLLKLISTYPDYLYKPEYEEDDEEEEEEDEPVTPKKTKSSRVLKKAEEPEEEDEDEEEQEEEESDEESEDEPEEEEDSEDEDEEEQEEDEPEDEDEEEQEVEIKPVVKKAGVRTIKRPSAPAASSDDDEIVALKKPTRKINRK
jgi:hypothetical protein